MGKPIRLVNLALGAVALLIAAALVRAWVTPPASHSIPPSVRASQEVTASSFVRASRPPLSHFDVVLEKSPFRKPPPVPVPPHAPGPPPPPPAPLPTLVGTILVDDERRAILSDKGKANIYSIGQDVAGGKLTAVSQDRVLFKRGDAVSELTLKAPIQSGGAPPPAAQPSPPPAPAPIPAAVPVSPPPGAIEGAPGTPESPLTRAQRRRARLLMQQQPQEAVPAPQEPTQ